nr:MAG TPA: hypothetical protein [Caudoviricetes sp.]
MYGALQIISNSFICLALLGVTSTEQLEAIIS